MNRRIRAHLEFGNQNPKPGALILEFKEQIRGTPILFAIFVSESEIRNHSNEKIGEAKK
jgi:hypothetical protein